MLRIPGKATQSKKNINDLQKDINKLHFRTLVQVRSAPQLETEDDDLTFNSWNVNYSDKSETLPSTTTTTTTTQSHVKPLPLQSLCMDMSDSSLLKDQSKKTTDSPLFAPSTFTLAPTALEEIGPSYFSKSNKSARVRLPRSHRSHSMPSIYVPLTGNFLSVFDDILSLPEQTENNQNQAVKNTQKSHSLHSRSFSLYSSPLSPKRSKQEVCQEGCIFCGKGYKVNPTQNKCEYETDTEEDTSDQEKVQSSQELDPQVLSTPYSFLSNLSTPSTANRNSWRSCGDSDLDSSSPSVSPAPLYLTPTHLSSTSTYLSLPTSTHLSLPTTHVSPTTTHISPPTTHLSPPTTNYLSPPEPFLSLPPSTVTLPLPSPLPHGGLKRSLTFQRSSSLPPPQTDRPSEEDTVPKNLSPEEVADILYGHTQISFGVTKVLVIDCRFPFEFQGGHIQNAVNVWTHHQLAQLYHHEKQNGKVVAFVFHCEFSQNRGPTMCRDFRRIDRSENTYPNISCPHLFIMETGYRRFYQSFSKLTFPNGYVEMDDEGYGQEKISCQQKKDKYKKIFDRIVEAKCQNPNH